MSLRPCHVDFSKKWADLESSLTKIITLSSMEKKVWDDRFHDIYALCVAVPDAHTEKLYGSTKTFLERHVGELYKKVSEVSEEQLLSTFFDTWKVYYRGATYIHSLYGYLNQQFIKKQKYTEADLCFGGITTEQLHQCMLEIGELALATWKSMLLHPLEKRLISQLIEAITDDRKDKSTVNHTVVKGVIQSLVEVEEYKMKQPLEFYENVFEKPFLDATADYYKREASELLDQCSCSAYMKKVIVRIQEEDLRARRFLNPSSYYKVQSVCQQVMVANHASVLHSVTKDLVCEEKTEDLSNMYLLLKPIPQAGLGNVVSEFETHVKRIGLDAVKGLKGDNIPGQFVESMLTIHVKYVDMVKATFDGDSDFSQALDRACLAAINYQVDSKTCPKASEWLAKYTDYLLRKSAKGLSEAEVDEKLSCAITIFRYIEDKDVFQKFYSRMLAQRLIHGASVSQDAEESMVNKLKQACGYEFTSKLHRMLQDIKVSQSDLQQQFSDYVSDNGHSLKVGFNILVLQAGAWPVNSQAMSTVFSVPEELQPSVQMESGSEVTDNSKFTLNMEFTSKRTKFKLAAPTIQRHHEKQEVEQVHTTVQQDRKYFLECTVVRIMKARKVLKHNQLIQEIISQSKSRFTPEIPFIKKIIEQLMEKQYLQRTDNPDEYAYLA